MKIVYIAHPISGDIEANLSDLRRIIRRINSESPRVVPLCSYYADIVSLDDNDPKDRERGMSNAKEVLRSGAVDEMWLTGDRMSSGMREEIDVAEEQGIPVHDFIRAL
jgi:hypothetical protein